MQFFDQYLNKFHFIKNHITTNKIPSVINWPLRSRFHPFDVLTMAENEKSVLKRDHGGLLPAKEEAASVSEVPHEDRGGLGPPGETESDGESPGDDDDGKTRDE